MSRHVVFSAVVPFLIVVVVGLATARAISAATPPPYAHAWYVTNPTASVMNNRGYNDGLRDNQTCTQALAILDFGQIANEGSAGYGGYGTYRFPYPFPYVSDAGIVAAAEAYAKGWYSVTGNCPRLKMVIGANNYNQCPSGGSCTPNGAGIQWGTLTNDVNSYLSSMGYSWQITAYAGSDMEQPGGGEDWDCATPTRQFVDGFNGNNPSLARFINYGTAWVPNSCWTAADVYYVSWGAHYNYPVPEIYFQSALDSWMAIDRSYPSMIFSGELTECTGSDPLPDTTCGSEWAPHYAWNTMWAALNNSQGSLDYSTNIKNQP